MTNDYSVIYFPSPFERNISENIKRKAETFGIETRFSKNKSLKSKLNVEDHTRKDQNGVV